MRLTLVTSISPGNQATQKRAISSWLAIPDVDVLSINSPVEFPQLREECHDPRVTFVEARRDGRDIIGRPLVRIYDAIETGRASGGSMVGIVNSDVMLRVPPGFVERIWPLVQGGLVFGARTDVEEFDSPTGEQCRWGFDYFFMDPAAAGHIVDEPFFIGVPWWDFWLPISFIIADRRTVRLASPIAFHVSHPPRWEPSLYEMVGAWYASFIRRNFARRGWSAIAGPTPQDPYWGHGTLKRLAQCDAVHI